MFTKTLPSLLPTTRPIFLFCTTPPPTIPPYTLAQLATIPLQWTTSKRTLAPNSLTNWLGEQQPDFFSGYEAQYNGKVLYLRVNDFPDQELYSLIVDDREVAHFSNRAKLWRFL